MKKKLPAPQNTFAEIRTGGYYYVDKTQYIYNLIQDDTFYFLARPQGFGKTLLIDTIHSLFNGEKHLFEGLWIEHHWDWNKTHPVVSLDFSNVSVKNEDELLKEIKKQLLQQAQKFGLHSEFEEGTPFIEQLVYHIYDTTQKDVVFLINDSDKPIFDNLENPDLAASLHRELTSLYSVVKEFDNLFEFALFTSEIYFTKASLFSGLNNITNITLDSRFSELCGFTETELEDTFEEELIDIVWEDMKRVCYGYSWRGDVLYSPGNLLNFLRGEPSLNHLWLKKEPSRIFYKAMVDSNVYIPRLLTYRLAASDLRFLDIDSISSIALLFQMGCSTIDKDYKYGSTPERYRLKFPNLETYLYYHECLFREFFKDSSDFQPNEVMRDARYALKFKDFNRLEQLVRMFFEAIPFDDYANKDLVLFRNFYANLFYAFFYQTVPIMLASEDYRYGRIDLLIKEDDVYYIFKFEVVEDDKANDVLEELVARDFAAKYRPLSEEIYLISVAFSQLNTKITSFEVIKDKGSKDENNKAMMQSRNAIPA